MNEQSLVNRKPQNLNNLVICDITSDENTDDNILTNDNLSSRLSCLTALSPHQNIVILHDIVNEIKNIKEQINELNDKINDKLDATTNNKSDYVLSQSYNVIDTNIQITPTRKKKCNIL